jgi:hypothetical protein
MTSIGAAGASRLEPPSPEIRIQILHVADCPLVGRVRQDVQACLERYGMDALIDDVEGPYPSPTLLVGDQDVTEQPPGIGPACRLNLPSRDQISRAIEAVLALPDYGAIDRSAITAVGRHPRDTHRLAVEGSP